MMKRKIAAMIMTAVMAAALAAGCGSQGGNKNGGGNNAPAENTGGASGESKPEEDGQFKIGVIQLGEHAALVSSYEGFVEGLKEAGFVDGENIAIDYQSAQNDPSNCVTIAEKFVNDDVDLILAIATPAAQAAASKTTEIPILVTAVTDPASSGLVDTNEAPGGNVSGTSDLTPVKEQIDLLIDLIPETETVGVLYCSSEDNSKFQGDLALEVLAEAGLTGETYTFSALDEIQAVVDSMKGKVDAIYIPTDNTAAEGMATISMIATEAGLPIIVGESGMVNNGGLATYGLSYFNLGKLTGEQAASILKGEAETATMPIAYLAAEDCEFTYNQEIADALGITIDPSRFK